MYQRILVALDGSPTSSKALVAALQLARQTGGRVRLVHAVDELGHVGGYDFTPDLMRVVHDYASQVLQDALGMAQDAGVPAEHRLIQAPGEHLGHLIAEEAAAWGADLVVTGTHGRRGLGRVLLGSGAEQIIRMAPVPVLAVRGSDVPPRKPA